LLPVLDSLGAGRHYDVGIPPVYAAVGFGVIVAIGGGIILGVVVVIRLLIRIRNNRTKT